MTTVLDRGGHIGQEVATFPGRWCVCGMLQRDYYLKMLLYICVGNKLRKSDVQLWPLLTLLLPLAAAVMCIPLCVSVSDCVYVC